MGKEILMEFSYNVSEPSPNTCELAMSGYFDEFARLPDDLDLTKYMQFIVDFEKVDFINSGGIKLWVNFVELLEANPEIQVVFRNCKRMIVDQINIVEGFIPKSGKVESVYVPIFCEKCEKSFNTKQLTSEINKNFGDILNRSQPDECDELPKCRQYFEVDVVSNQFFRFLDDR